MWYKPIKFGAETGRHMVVTFAERVHIFIKRASELIDMMDDRTAGPNVPCVRTKRRLPKPSADISASAKTRQTILTSKNHRLYFRRLWHAKRFPVMGIASLGLSLCLA